MRDGKPPDDDNPHLSQPDAKDESYSTGSNTRNVCFVFLNGNRVFLNYGYLVSGEYFPDANIITLTWTSHLVTLAGIYLEALFYEFMQHLPRQVLCADARYNVVAEKKPIVNDIRINKNGE